MHPALPRAVALVALLQFEPLAAAQECTAATPWFCGPTDTLGGWSDDDVVLVQEVTEPHGSTIALHIFARDLADPAVAVKNFCAVHGFAGVETCAQEIMHGLAPELDRLRGQHAAAMPPPDSPASASDREVKVSCYPGSGEYDLDRPDGRQLESFEQSTRHSRVAYQIDGLQLSWSEHGQDRYIDSLLKHKREGFFVEIGAFDGEAYSNTLFLETRRGIPM